MSVIYRYRSARPDFVPLLLPAERILPKDREEERERVSKRETGAWMRDRKRALVQDEKEKRKRDR